MHLMKGRVAIAAGFTLAVLAAACGSSSDSSKATAPAATPAAQGAGQATAAPGGTAQASNQTTPAPASNVTLTLYNAQRVELAEAWTADFTKETGIKVNIRSGKDFELANQIVQEGAGSPADLFITENSPAMTLVANKGQFAPVDKATLAQVPSRFASPNGDWLGIAARATVLVYNPSMLAASALPASIMDLSAPAWKGKIGVAAAGADFQAIVSAVLALKGPDATAAWLKGLKENAKIYSGNGAVMRAVNAGEISAGVIYHYYWFQDRAESGANSSKTELLFFGGKDPGGFVSVSGGGVLKSSKYPKEAQMLLAYITGKRGQQLLADSAFLEYTVGSDVAANPKLKPLSEISPPDVDLSKLNGPQTVELMQQAGLL